MSLLAEMATLPEFRTLATAWSRTVELVSAGAPADFEAIAKASTATGAARDIVARYLNPGRMAAFDAARGAISDLSPAVRSNALSTLHQGLGESATMMAEHGGYGAFMIASPDKVELASLLRNVGGYVRATA